ncbi:DUF6174 domain-containing protein [Nocardioides ferulae]|uniref:DUF6174 domain-containing protein n=1 Tax=Nocardioides ferulae TaxID=2340821 RepID=UPI000EAF069B|nr:DUF6174 domain-containing protein [Nocardioides ferulae]
MTRPPHHRLLPLLGGVLLAAGCTGEAGTDRGSGASTAPLPAVTAELPTSYRLVLESMCGERSFLGRYRVVVRDGVVRRADPISPTTYRPDLADVPTLEGLIARAESAGEDAVVDLAVDDEGIPESLTIDHLPDAIDDEECYRVSRLRTGQ